MFAAIFQKICHFNSSIKTGDEPIFSGQSDINTPIVSNFKNTLNQSIQKISQQSLDSDPLPDHHINKEFSRGFFAQVNMNMNELKNGSSVKSDDIKKKSSNPLLNEILDKEKYQIVPCELCAQPVSYYQKGKEALDESAITNTNGKSNNNLVHFRRENKEAILQLQSNGYKLIHNKTRNENIQLDKSILKTKLVNITTFKFQSSFSQLKNFEGKLTTASQTPHHLSPFQLDSENNNVKNMIDRNTENGLSVLKNRSSSALIDLFTKNAKVLKEDVLFNHPKEPFQSIMDKSFVKIPDVLLKENSKEKLNLTSGISEKKVQSKAQKGKSPLNDNSNLQKFAINKTEFSDNKCRIEYFNSHAETKSKFSQDIGNLFDSIRPKTMDNSHTINYPQQDANPNLNDSMKENTLTFSNKQADLLKSVDDPAQVHETFIFRSVDRSQTVKLNTPYQVRLTPGNTSGWSIVEPMEFISSLAKQVQFAFLRNDREFFIQLKPESLGLLRFKLKMKGKKLSGRIEVYSQEVHQILVKHAHELNHRLEELQIPMESLEFDMMDAGHNHQSGQGSGNNRNTINQYSKLEEETTLPFTEKSKDRVQYSYSTFEYIV